MKVYASADRRRAIAVEDDSIIAAYGLFNVLCCEPDGLIETEGLQETDAEFRWTERA